MKAKQRNIMKSARVIAAVCLLSGVSPVLADSFDFEDLPNANISLPFGGGSDIGTFYNAVTFGAGVQGVYTSSAFPATSGSQLIWQSDILNPNIDITPNGSFTEVSFWYTTAFGFTVTAYDALNNVVGSFTAPVNSDPFVFNVGTPSFVDLNSSSGAAIAFVQVVDGAGIGNYIGIDDLTVPDATSTLALMGVSAMSLFAFRRKIVTQ